MLGAQTVTLEPFAVRTERLVARAFSAILRLDVVAFRTTCVVMVYGLLDRMPRRLLGHRCLPADESLRVLLYHPGQ